MALIDVIGYVAATCTTVSFLPQAMRIFKTKDCSGISLTMYIVFTFGVAAWLAFGIMQTNWPIILANAVTLVLASCILYFTIKYR